MNSAAWHIYVQVLVWLYVLSLGVDTGVELLDHVVMWNGRPHKPAQGFSCQVCLPFVPLSQCGSLGLSLKLDSLDSACFVSSGLAVLLGPQCHQL